MGDLLKLDAFWEPRSDDTLSSANTSLLVSVGSPTGNPPGSKIQRVHSQKYKRRVQGSHSGFNSMDQSILWKELVPIVIAYVIWARYCRRCAVTVHCDNMGAVAVVNSGYSRKSPIMHLLRCLFFIRATYQFSLYAVHRATYQFSLYTVHIPGTQNL